MTAATLEVIDVFHITGMPGPMLFCRHTGMVHSGDVFELRLRSGEVVHGTVFTFNPHSRLGAGPDELNLGIEGPAADHLEAGSRLTRVSAPGDRARDRLPQA
jgi:hypothetical protein